MKLVAFFLLIACVSAKAQTDSLTVIRESKKFQQELNKSYKNKKTSPLNAADLKKFRQHDFFPISANYAVLAKVTLTPDSPYTPMAATGPIVNNYRAYAIAEFELHGQPCKLTLYQSRELSSNPEYRDYLFLPFTDTTTGDESYGGGRYLDVRIPKGDTILLNFNLAYNPYCAYSNRYSCPKVPANNDLPVAIKAGVRLETTH
ncbi:MAG: DUF1684 domain-containing protein [Cyclobacteriaceae bacterium]|nr:DUF1684 domain-containing protein [Cyclobacteriaceae bacterium]